MSILDNLKNRLVSYYNTDDNSNISKLLFVIAREIEAVRDNLDLIENYRDIDQAKGKTLDYIGQNVQRKRGSLNDLQYRRFLKLQIIINQSKGDIPTLNEIAQVLLQEPFIGFEENWQEEMASLYLVYDYLSLFEQIAEEYEEYENDPWYLDGEYYLDGTRDLDGGIYYDASNKLDDVTSLIENTSTAIQTAKAGGVKLYYKIPIDLSNKIKAEQSLDKKFIKSVENNAEREESLSKQINKSLTNSAINYLDGTHNLDGRWEMDGSRDRFVHHLNIEVI